MYLPLEIISYDNKQLNERAASLQKEQRKSPTSRHPRRPSGRWLGQEKVEVAKFTRTKEQAHCFILANLAASTFS